MSVYVSIGNSDDKLTQARWSEFQIEFHKLFQGYAERIHGVWYSSPIQPYQNMCLCAEIHPNDAEMMQARLASMARKYGQDSIAWAEATTTFIPAEPA